MRKVLFILIILLTTLVAGAQPGGAGIKFNETKHDFGRFMEEAGPQTFKFEFENTGTSDLLINRVTASCGCTSPEWTRHPLKPGEKGYVAVTYDPRNRPNKFKKTVAVYTNTQPAVHVLIIEGDVIPRKLTLEEIYRFDAGGVRFKSNHLAFTNVVQGKKKIKIMEIINTLDKPVNIGFDRVPGHVTLKTKPATLGPGDKGVIEGMYDASNLNDWGYVNHLIRVTHNGEMINNSWFVVSANIIEDFSSWTKNELENAPVFDLENTRFNFGEIKQREKADVEFKFKNSGKSDLIIRKVRSTCGCTTVTPANTTIKPGESSIIKAVFDAGIRKGKQHKVITVITNDPNKSQVSLVISGIVLEND
ncbi:MAG TPA: DUF1573 domain-containing protein [Bacteroidales bacterium]|nr:DUF1573 domain-containing protein [Bacteroidales bacterium]